MKVRIEITKGPDSGRNFVLEANEKRIIGRGENVPIRMLDELISREHCEIEFDGKSLFIRDLDSTNHTFVQQNLNQPITPHERYEIADKSCFFVGPESRFSVVYEPNASEAAQLPPASTQSAGGNSNFSASLISPGNRGPTTGGDSSIFNLTGAAANAPGLEDVGQPPRKAPPPQRPERLPSSQPEKTSGYDSNSIVPPGQQGLESGVFRDQVADEEYVDESHLKSTPSAIERMPDDADEEVAEEQEPAPPPSQNLSPLASLFPPAKIESPSTVDQSRKRPKAETTPVSYGPAESGFRESAPSHSPFDSIASPGVSYPEHAAPLSPAPSTPPPFPESDVAPVTEMAPAESAAKIQDNGLYFHTGAKIEMIAQIISEVGKKLNPVFCVDMTRISSPESNQPTDALPTQEAESGLDRETSENLSTGSNFDLEENNDSPIETTADPANKPPVVGTPLFDFLPKELQDNGPVLLTKDQFDISLEEIWHQDGLIVFFGKDVDQILSHLRRLLQTNIQTGKPSRAMFGFCWPSVLHSTLESQSRESVARIFDDCVSCILLEDPQERFEWNLVAQQDLTPEFGWLGGS